MFVNFILAKHLHEASKQVMQNRYSQNDEMEPDEELHEVADQVHYDTHGRDDTKQQKSEKPARG